MLPRGFVVLLLALPAGACAAEGSTAAEIDEADDGAGSATTMPDASKSTVAKDASVDARDSSASDAKSTGADADSAQDAASDAAKDAAKDSSGKDADAAKDSSTTGADCPVNPTYIAKAFAELIGSSPTMCLTNACPASKCCVQLYGVCVDK